MHEGIERVERREIREKRKREDRRQSINNAIIMTMRRSKFFNDEDEEVRRSFVFETQCR